MPEDSEAYKLRTEYSAAMGEYEAATDALRQFDRNLYDGPMLDFATVVLEGQQFKMEEEASYKRLSKAREAYFRLSH